MRLDALPEVRSVYTTVGAQGGGNGPTGGGSSGNVRRGSLVIQLDNPDGTRGAQQIFERKATEMLRDIPGARFQFGGGGGGSRLQVTLAGDEPNRLNLAAANVEREIRAMPGLGMITSSAALQKPEIVIRPLPERAAELGVTTETLSLVTRIATSGDVNTSLAKFNLDNRQIPILVRLNDTSRSDLERLQLLSVPGRNGPVPLMNVADVSLGAGPAQIARVDRSRNITLNVDLNQLALGDTLAAIEALPSVHEPAGRRALGADGRRALDQGDLRRVRARDGDRRAVDLRRARHAVPQVHSARDDLGGAAAVGGRRHRGAAHLRLQPRDQFVDRLADADGHRVEELHLDRRVRDHGATRSRHVAVRLVDRLLLEARAAHRHDDDRDDRGHDCRSRWAGPAIRASARRWASPSSAACSSRRS